MARKNKQPPLDDYFEPERRWAPIVLAVVIGGLLVGVWAVRGKFASTVLLTHRPTPTPTPKPTPMSPLDEVLGYAVRALKSGRIAFEYPEAMKLDETKRVEVRISETQDKELTEGLSQTDAHVQVGDIKIAPMMATSLKGSAFEITPLTSEEQVIAADQPTSWVWSIHPTDWGQQSLYLAVCIRFALPKREERRCASVYQKEIEVHVNPMYAATHFIKNNATWTLGALGSGFSALGGGIMLLSKRKKKSRAAGFGA